MRKLLLALTLSAFGLTNVPAHAIAYRAVNLTARLVVASNVLQSCTPNATPLVSGVTLAEGGAADGAPIDHTGLWRSRDCMTYDQRDGKMHVFGGGWFGNPGDSVLTSDTITIQYNLTQLDNPDQPVATMMMFYGTWSVVSTTGQFAGWHGLSQNMNMLAHYDAVLGAGEATIFGALYCESAEGRPPPPDACAH